MIRFLPLALLIAAMIGFALLPSSSQDADAQRLFRGDVVFLIDESGSMSNDVAEVKSSVNDIANQLAAAGSVRLGLVGFGASSGIHGSAFSGQPHIHTALTSDLSAFTTAVNDLVDSGGDEPGFGATVLGMSDTMGFRQDAGVCSILITDEDADIYASAPETKSDALAALNGRNATLISVVDPTFGTAADDYGPNPGSLAVETGGDTFDILDFRADPDPVLTEILDSCIEEIREKPTARRVVLFVNGIGSSATCPSGYSGDLRWLRNYLNGVDGLGQWVKSAAGTLDDFEFFYYAYSSADNDSPTYCSPDGRVGTYERADTCWSIDDGSPRGPVKGQGARLDEFIRDRVLAGHSDTEIDLIVFSQGGVVATYAAATSADLRGKLNSVVTMDSPLAGSILAPGAQAIIAGCPFFDLRYDSPEDMLFWSNTNRTLRSGAQSYRLYTIDADPGHIGPPDWMSQVPGQTAHIRVGATTHSDIWRGVTASRGALGRATELVRLKQFIGCAVAGLPDCAGFANGDGRAIQQFETATSAWTVRSGTTRMTVISQWSGSTVTTTLTSPSGRMIDGDTIALDVGHEAGDTFEIFEVDTPEAGTWTVELFGADVPPEGEEVFLSFTSEPDPSVDADGDLIWDDEDNCVGVSNGSQMDTDEDGLGDACDDDKDNDGVANADDNCEFVPNPGQEDENENGIGDACDPELNDLDGDGVLDGVDNCPLDSNADQSDVDSDGFGDTCDDDFVLVIPTPTPTPTPTPVVLAATAIPTPTPAVAEVVELPTAGGTPPGSARGPVVTWLILLGTAGLMLGALGWAAFVLAKRRHG